MIHCTSKLEDIPKKILTQLKRLNFNSAKKAWYATMMYHQLERFIKFEKARKNSKIFYLEEDGKVLSWAIVQKSGRNNLVSFFTRKSERRKGYGSLVYQEVMKHYKKLSIQPHDLQSAGFYDKVAKSSDLTNRSKKKLENFKSYEKP